MKCPIIPPEQIAEIKANTKEHIRVQTSAPIDKDAIIRALEPANEYFITTSLYWDCECEHNYTRPADMNMCENCGTTQDESPNARIGELRRHGIHVDWTAPNIVKTLEEHNVLSRTAFQPHK